jgi:hypothetical protein
MSISPTRRKKAQQTSERLTALSQDSRADGPLKSKARRLAGTLAKLAKGPRRTLKKRPE